MKYIYFSCLLFIAAVSLPLQSQWQRQYPSIAPTSVMDIAFVSKTTGFYSTYDGAIFKTTDQGATWKESVRKSRDFVQSLVFSDSLNGVGILPHNYIGDQLNILQTTNGGSTWTERFIGPFNEFSFMIWSGNKLHSVRPGLWLMSSYQGSIRRSTNFTDWLPVSQYGMFFPSDYGMPVATTTAFVQPAPNRILALSNKEEYQKYKHIKDSVSIILRSDSTGTAWDTLWVGADVPLISFTFSDSRNGWMCGKFGTILKTTDGGVSWKRVHRDSSLTLGHITAVDSLNIHAVDLKTCVLNSTDGGIVWTKSTAAVNGFLPKVHFVNKDVGFLSGYSGEPLRTTDGGKNWITAPAGIDALIRKIDFVSPFIGWAIAGGRVYRSIDKGLSWIQQDSVKLTNMISIDMLDTLNGWAGGNKKLFRTTDGGMSWTEKFSSDGIASFRSIDFFDARLGAISEARNLQNEAVNYITVDSGNTWTPYVMPEPVSSYPKLQFTDYSHGWIVEQGEVWCTNDTGKTWTKIYSDGIGTPSWGFDFIDSLRGWKSDFAVQYTTDGGKTWKSGSKPYSEQIQDVKFISPKQGFAVGYDGSIFSTSNGGTTWNANSHRSRVTLMSLSAVKQGQNASVWAGGASFVVEYAPFIVDGVQRIEILPEQLSLSQNYPNPFNPTTRIEFALPHASDVSLKIYDVIGREVTQLMNEQKNAGRYSVEWNGRDHFGIPVSSGIYFYTFRSGGIVLSKKMLLLK